MESLIPIAQLGETLPSSDFQSKAIRGLVTLIWPYSSSTRSAAVLLAEPDYRLRRTRGQVRVQFTGAAARAIALAKIGIGDELVLRLDGAQSVDAAAGISTPGKSVEIELKYKRKVLCEIFRQQQSYKKVVVDDDTPSEPSSPAAPLDSSHDLTPSLPTPFLARNNGLSTPVSVAFHRRARVTSGELVDSPYDPFVSDEQSVGTGRKRQRISWGSGSKWRVNSVAPTPSKRARKIDWVQDEDFQTPRKSERAAGVRPVTPTSPSPEDTESDHELLATSSQLEEATRRYTQELVNAVSGDTEQEDCSDGTDEEPEQDDEQVLSRAFGSSPIDRLSKFAVFNDSASAPPNYNLQQSFPNAVYPQSADAQEHLSDALRQAEEDFLDLPSSSPPAEVTKSTQSAAAPVSSPAARPEPRMQNLLEVDDNKVPEALQKSPSLLGQQSSIECPEDIESAHHESQQKNLQPQEIDEMPPPTFHKPHIPRLNTNASDDRVLSANEVGSPVTPMLAPLVSAGLPLPSPFPGDELSSYMESVPLQGSGFLAPPPPEALPDYMFQAGFGFGSQSFMRDPSLSPQKQSQQLGSQLHEAVLDPRQDLEADDLRPTDVEIVQAPAADAIFDIKSHFGPPEVLESRTVGAPVQYPELLPSNVDESQFHDLTAIVEESEDDDDLPVRQEAGAEVRSKPSREEVIILSSDKSTDDGAEANNEREQYDVAAESDPAASQFSPSVSQRHVPQRPRSYFRPVNDLEDDSQKTEDDERLLLADGSELAAPAFEKSGSRYEVSVKEDSDSEHDVSSELSLEDQHENHQLDDLSSASDEDGDESEGVGDKWDDDDSEPAHKETSSMMEQTQFMEREEEDSVLGPASHSHLAPSTDANNLSRRGYPPAGSQSTAISAATSVPPGSSGYDQDNKARSILDGHAIDDEVIPSSLPESTQVKQTQSAEQPSDEQSVSRGEAEAPIPVVDRTTEVLLQRGRQKSPLTENGDQSNGLTVDSHERDVGSLYEPSLRARAAVAFAPRVTRRRAAQEASSTAELQLQSSAPLQDSQSQSFNRPRLTIEDTFDGNLHHDDSITTMAPSGSEDVRNAQIFRDEESDSAEEGSLTPRPRPHISQLDGAAESIPSSPPPYEQHELVHDDVPYLRVSEIAESVVEGPQSTTQTLPIASQTSQQFSSQVTTSGGSIADVDSLPPTQGVTPTTVHQSFYTADEGKSQALQNSMDSRPENMVFNDEAVATLSPWFGRDIGVVKSGDAEIESMGAPKLAASAEKLAVTPSVAESTQTPPIDSQLPAYEDFSFSQSQRSGAKGILTDLCYYVPLANLISYLHVPSNSQGYPDNGVDLMAIVTKSTTKPLRADSGPRDFYTTLAVTDDSIFPQKITVQVFRPWRAALPKAESGDVILLRGFDVLSAKGNVGFTLRSGEGAAWCVWHWTGNESQENNSSFEGSLNLIGVAEKPWTTREASGALPVAQREEVRGPPVDIGYGERENVERLRAWWGEVKRHELQTQSQTSINRSSNGGVGGQGLESEVVLG